MGKFRTDVSAHIATEVLFESDNTCCVCREPGKAIQIHHIDKIPNNHKINNLCVLCLECHNKTELSGGFGRQFNEKVITKYRNEWLERIKKRRDSADDIVVDKLAGIKGTDLEIRECDNKFEIKLPSKEFLYWLPKVRADLRRRSQPGWDSGVTAQMVQASYDYISGIRGILLSLANFYDSGCFGPQTREIYFSEIIASRFQWHRSHAEPEGPGTGGTIINVIVCGKVMAEVDKMVQEMVISLAGISEGFDHEYWQSQWRTAKY